MANVILEVRHSIKLIGDGSGRARSHIDFCRLAVRQEKGNSKTSEVSFAFDKDVTDEEFCTTTPVRYYPDADDRNYTEFGDGKENDGEALLKALAEMLGYNLVPK